ncbi:DUF4229 domain-containing protein [Paraoerskovia marina]|uniref:DUF4229 domain-containing protein n=1 Tax=Paraoerskovia marina TaxID=545619 RepID=UPI000492BC7D|nr:DUF4229 domain-containing protein [Paraoerskovia marina]
MPFVVYSLLRLAVFAGVLVALYAVGMRDWLLIVVAALAAFFVSYLALNGPRTRASEYLAARSEHRRATGEKFSREIEDEAAYEDAADDAARGLDRRGGGAELEGETEPEKDAEGELEHPGPGEHADEAGSGRTGQDR